MRRPVDEAELELLRAAILKRLGLHLEGASPALLATLALERVDATRAPSLAAYARRIEAGELAGELRLLAERLTVGETYFFRNEHDLRAFTDLAVPELRAARAAERRLRILSAGCATGEEPYTLAMLVSSASELAGWDVRIRAVDVSPAAIERARRGRYGAWSLRQTPDATRARFFVADGREHRVAPAVASLVDFEERNLVDDDPALWTPGGYDVVFCRNVTMYFPPHVARAVLARIAASLAPGGFLFLGHAETLFGLSTDFDVREARGAFIYQRRGEAGARASPAGDVAPAGAGPGWLEAIHAASERVSALVARHEPAPAPAPSAGGGAARDPAGAGATSPAAGRMEAALALMREERFGPALAALGDPACDAGDPRALLLRAVLHLVLGERGAAEAACGRLVALGELGPEAHHVLALCRAEAGDPAGAAEHDRYALHLDPSFALARLHLGRLARRAGALVDARAELSRALASLAVEDEARVALLAGGFAREALVDLCRAELRGCEEAR